MKFYRDEEGNLYEVDRATGKKTLIQETESAGDIGTEKNADDNTTEDE